MFNIKMTKECAERFWHNVDIGKKDECWEWKAGSFDHGYGCFNINKKSLVASRISYFLANGEFNSNLCVLHKCDNPPCVNPDHLFLGTKADNNKDRASKGRSGKMPIEARSRGLKHSIATKARTPRGESHPHAKLKEDDIRIIRKDSRMLREIANDFNVTPQLIWQIRKHRAWAHVI